MTRPHRLDGHWLEVAQAIVAGAGTHREIAAAIRKPTEGVNRIRKGVSVSVPEMISVGLVGHDNDGRYRLTDKGLEQLEASDA